MSATSALMQAAMDRLGSFISRRRKSRPGHLDRPPGGLAPVLRDADASTSRRAASRSPARSRRSSPSSIKKFPGVEAEKLVFVFDNTKGDKAEDRRGDHQGRRRHQGRRGRRRSSRSPSRPRAPGARQADRPDAAKVTGSADQTADAAAEIRKNADILKGDDAVSPIHLVGQQALWAGMQDLSKEDLEKAEVVGFPIVFIVLLLIFGSRRRGAAAAQPRLRRRGRHRRDRLLPLAGDRDVDLRDQHRVDARHRRRGRLLAVHPRPLPGGAQGRARPRTRRAGSRCGPPAWPWRSPA